jgi:hypothetical protein
MPAPMRMRSGIYRSVRCVDGRLMRHHPQLDDPDLETDIGLCSICNGKGCEFIYEVPLAVVTQKLDP